MAEEFKIEQMEKEVEPQNQNQTKNTKEVNTPPHPQAALRSRTVSVRCRTTSGCLPA